MAEEVDPAARELAAKPNDLNSVPGFHLVEGVS